MVQLRERRRKLSYGDSMLSDEDGFNLDDSSDGSDIGGLKTKGKGKALLPSKKPIEHDLICEGEKSTMPVDSSGKKATALKTHDKKIVVLSDSENSDKNVDFNSSEVSIIRCLMCCA